jgi:acyl-CoA dehydrogenase
VFEPEHDEFRRSAREFVQRDVAPHTEEWIKAGMSDRAFWKRAASAGFVGMDVPEQYGGAGIADYRFNVVLNEEVCFACALPDMFTLQNDVVGNYLITLTNEEQRERWLPAFVRGDLVGSIAMSEPQAGSDLRGIATVARPTSNGYAISGSKTFIGGGIQADLIIVAARVEGAEPGVLTLFAVETNRDGFSRGRKLAKVGRHESDTAELFFDETEIPTENRIGEENLGLDHLKAHLPRERLSIAVCAVASAEAAFDLTLEYAHDRETFGKPISEHQAIRHALAEMRADLDAGRSYLDRCLAAYVRGELTAADAAGVKFWTTEMQFRVTDVCLQLHGGYGYMTEYPISRLWRDARAQRLFGGTTEILKDVLGKSLRRA